jgi:hypothetical protein
MDFPVGFYFILCRFWGGGRPSCCLPQTLRPPYAHLQPFAIGDGADTTGRTGHEHPHQKPPQDPAGPTGQGAP